MRHNSDISSSQSWPTTCFTFFSPNPPRTSLIIFLSLLSFIWAVDVERGLHFIISCGYPTHKTTTTQKKKEEEKREKCEKEEVENKEKVVTVEDDEKREINLRRAWEQSKERNRHNTLGHEMKVFGDDNGTKKNSKSQKEKCFPRR